MTQGNFNWFLHTMLFYHTRIVIQKQRTGKEDHLAEENVDNEVDDSL
jgi:hypothetical protein